MEWVKRIKERYFSKEVVKPLTPEKESHNEEESYNNVYETLVKNNNDIAGQIAYCFYKKNKQTYIKEFRKKHNKNPSDEEINNHVEFSEKPRLHIYEELASAILKKIIIDAVQESSHQLTEKFKNDLWHYVTMYEKEGFLERQYIKGKSLIVGGVGGVIGNVLTTLLLVLFLFIFSSSESKDAFFYNGKNNLISGLAKVIGVNVEIKEPTTSK